MNPNQITGVIRDVLMSLGATFVTGGYLTTDQLSMIIGGLVTVGAVAWTLFRNKKGTIVVAAADIVPITAAAQASAGITEPQIVPTNPKKLS